MSSTQDQYAEARDMAQLLVSIAERAKADFAETVAPFGLPVHLARALLLLDNPAPMRELADHLACDRSYVTGLADGLEERGLVTRVAGSDRRIRLLALTETGQVTRNQIADAIAENNVFLQRLTPTQRAELVGLLTKLLPETPTHG